MKALAPALAATLIVLAAPLGICAERPAAAPAPPTAAAPAASADKIDVNRAAAAELLAVPGIGPRMAQAIIDFRAARGPFARLEDLLQVRGIKEKTLKAIAPYLVCGAPTAPQAKAR